MPPSRKRPLGLFGLVALGWAISLPAMADYPVQRPARITPAPPESLFTVHPDQAQQVIKGLGFEIQSDSIGSGNEGLPEAATSVPHDLTPEERTRFSREMLQGFRYCRLAGGLYWRGLDAEQKYLRPRWPEQLNELRDMLQTAGVEGVEFEYWSPAPFWKANGQYTARKKNDAENRLRCFGANFATDPVYHGDVDRFLGDFAAACRTDLQTLKDAGIPVIFWGLQNEPFANCPYSSCIYRPADYTRTFVAVAPIIRAFDPNIQLVADTDTGWKFHFIRPALKQPETAGLVMHWSPITSAPIPARNFLHLSPPAKPASTMSTSTWAAGLPGALPQHGAGHHELVSDRPRANLVLAARAQARDAFGSQRLRARLLATRRRDGSGSCGAVPGPRAGTLGVE